LENRITHFFSQKYLQSFAIFSSSPPPPLSKIYWCLSCLFSWLIWMQTFQKLDRDKWIHKEGNLVCQCVDSPNRFFCSLKIEISS
jgi:hypothetical protein